MARWGLIPAAGIGKRMGSAIPKQYLKLHDREVLAWTLEAIQRSGELSAVVLVLNPDDQYFAGHLAREFPEVICVSGGNERLNSVARGLDKIAELGKDEDWVLVHDAVRPCVRKEDISKLIAELAGHETGGILASPVRDTLKHSDANGQVRETLPRELYWLAATPQMFRLHKLRAAIRALEEKNAIATDEAAAIEQMGWPVQLVAGRSDNIKITAPEDLPLAEFLLREQARSRAQD